VPVAKKFVPGARRRSDGEAYLVLILNGSLSASVSADGQAVEFAPRSGGLAVLRYGQLEVRDSTGRQLTSWIEGFAEAGVRGIRIVFDDADAVYPVVVDPLLTTAAWSVEGEQQDDYLGWAVSSAGDVNADGYDDVIVGAYGYDRWGDKIGKVFVYYGSASGLDTNAAWTVEGSQLGSRFGYVVSSAGDVNCDGISDVIVGAPYYDGSEEQEGRVYVYHGSQDNGLSSTPDWIAQGSQYHGYFGDSVSTAGDVNGDGCDEVIVGAFSENGVLVDEGQAYVYYGSVDGLNVDYDWLAGSGQIRAYFGSSVSTAGDVNGDDYADVIIGAQGYDFGVGNEEWGRVFIYHGSADGLSTDPDWTADGDSNVGQLGRAVSTAGDVNGDGYDDVIAGAPFFDNDDVTQQDKGRAFVYYGSPLVMSSTPDWVVEGIQYSRLGAHVSAAGDVNGDGYDDVVVGASRGDSHGLDDPGRTLVFEGSADGLPPDQQAWAWATDGFGAGVSGAGDVNGDGYDDVIVGDPWHSRTALRQGRAAVYHGAPRITGLTLARDLGFASGSIEDSRWQVQPGPTTGALPNNATPDAVTRGPFPGSVLVTSGRTVDRTTVTDFPRSATGITDVDWGNDGEGDVATYELELEVPPWARTLRFTTQYLTNDYPFDTDSASFSFFMNGGSPDFPLGEAPRWFVDGPVSHCIDLTGASRITLRFRVEDVDASEDSGVLLSRAFFSGLPFPSDITLENDGVDGNGDGRVDYFVNPTPHDVSLTAGTFTHVVDLFEIPGVSMPFRFSIVYNSQSDREGTLGRKWTHSYTGYVQEILADEDQDGTPETLDTLLVRHGAGTYDYFEPDPRGGFRPKVPDSRNTLIDNGDGSFSLLTGDHMRYDFTVDDGAQQEYRLLSKVTDPNGNFFTLSYWDDNGTQKIDHITDTRGETIDFSYAHGNLTSIAYDWTTPAMEAATSYVELDYDLATNDLISVTDLLGYTTGFTYDPFGNLLSVTDTDGVTTVANSFEQYQGLDVLQVGDRVVSRRGAKDDDPFDPEAGIAFEYDGEAVCQTDRLGHQDTRGYDVEGRMARRVDPGGVLWEYEFDRRGNIVRTRRKLPSEDWPRTVSVSTYDDDGNLTSRTDYPSTCIGGPSMGDPCGDDSECDESSCGARTSWTYDIYGSVLAVTDHYGNTTSYRYDSNHNLLAWIDPLGNTTSDRYTTFGQSESTITAKGDVFTCSYDAPLDRPTSAESPDGAIVSYVYDALGHLVRTTDPNGHATTVEYDDLGRAVRQTDPLGNTTEYAYDAYGRPLWTREANGALTSFQYTATGRLASETSPLGNTTSYGYDDQDRVTSMIDPLGRETRFEYDAVGRVTRVVACDAASVDCDLGLEVRARFDEVGNVVELIDAQSRSIHFEYDLLGRVTRERDGLNHEIRYSYDGRGLMTQEVNARGQEITFQYDAASRPTAVLLNGGASIQHTLDAHGNAVTSASDRYAGVTRAFDEMGRLVGRTDEFDNTIRYEYDLAGNLRTLIYTDGSRVVYSYDALNRLIRIEDWYDPANPPPDPPGVDDCAMAGNSCHQTGYGYDSVGNLTQVTLPDGSMVTYTYDLAHRLVGVVDQSSAAGTIFAASFSLNAAGQRVSADITAPLEAQVTQEVNDLGHNELNQVVTRDADVFAYDPDGNLTSGVLGGAPVTLSYDELNQLTQINGDTFRYDVDGMRVQATREGVTRRYVYDPNAELSRLLEEHDESGNLVARYVYGLGLVSRDGPGTQGYRVYHYDSRGSTVALTDGSGGITDAYAYDPYGNPAGYEDRTPGDPESGNPFRYNGQTGVIDDGNGLYYMRARYYAPELARFIQQDVVPTGLTDTQALNRYSFVSGNPIQFNDPDGNWFGIDDALAFIGGTLVGIVSQGIECAVSGSGCGWEDFVGAAAGGAAGAGVLLYTGNPILAGAAGGFVDAAMTHGMKAIPGGQETSWAEAGIDIGIGTGLGAAMGLVGGKGPAGFSSVKNLAKQQGKRAVTKLFRDEGLRAAFSLGVANYTGKNLITGGVGKGVVKGLWGRFGPQWGGGDGGTGPGGPLPGRSLSPPGSVWNQYSNPRADAWATSAGRSCAEFAWR
jgi:RHS repeat-associated protein